MVRENIFQIINVSCDIIWTIFPYFCSYWAINSQKRKCSLFVLQLFPSISQSPIVGTQTFIYVELVPLGRSSSDGFNCLYSFFFACHDHNPSFSKTWRWLCHSVQTIKCLNLFPGFASTNILKHSTHCWLKLFEFDWRRHPYYVNKFTSRVLKVFFSIFCLSFDDICLDRTLLSCLATETSYSNFW